MNRPASKYPCGLLPAFLAMAVTLVIPLSTYAAETRTFSLGGVPVVLKNSTPEVAVFYRSMRFNRALNVWNAELVLSNRSAQILRGPFLLHVTNSVNTPGLLDSDGTQDSRPFYDLSPFVAGEGLGPGAISKPRTITLGIAPGAPALFSAFFTRSDAESAGALALTRSLDEAGQPLPGAGIQEVGPAGSRTLQSDSHLGLATLGGVTGPHVWQFTHSNYLPAWRQSTLASNVVSLVANPRLTARNTNRVSITATGGEIVTGDLRVTAPASAFGQSSDSLLTRLTSQTLPAFLPQGWSPFQAFWLELTSEPAQPLVVNAQLWGNVSSNETVAWVRLDTNNLAWRVIQLANGDGSSNATALIPGSGAYAAVLPDVGPGAPPFAVVGESLQSGSTPPANTFSLTASGIVEPATSPASRSAALVTAQATIVFSNASPLPSGTVLRGEITESYQMQDGTRRITPGYEAFVHAFQKPGDDRTETLHGHLPMRPLLLFGGDELVEARVRLDVLPDAEFSGTVIETNGAELLSEGIRLIAGAGTFAQREAAYLRRIETSQLTSLNISSNEAVLGFELGMAETVSGKPLALVLPNQNTNSLFVLARLVRRSGVYGYEPVQRFASDATGRLTSLEPATGERLPGITGAGTYILLRVGRPQGLVHGITRDTGGTARPDMVVRLNPWTTFSAADGSFRLLAATGAVSVALTDLANGNEAQQSTVVANPGIPTEVDLSARPTGPRVVSATPTGTAVSRVTPIVVTFSEPVNPGTVAGSGVQLIGTNGQPVAASVNLNLRNTIVTLLPTSPLAPNSRFTIHVSSNITDSSGLVLEGPNAFTFTTENDAIARSGAQLIIFEPTNGLAAMFGTPGSADPESPVILVNETSGETATILSKPDGSFTNFLAADVDDFLSAVLVNQNGTRTTLPASRQIFRDGHVGLFRGGGILEAESDGGRIQVIIEPGAIPARTTFKLDVIPLNELLAMVEGQQPIGGSLIGGFRYEESGDDMKTPADVAFPVTVAQLGLPPGVAPEDRSYALVVPAKYGDSVVFDLLDTMVFEETEPGKGRLVTRSPPFPGLLARQLAAFRAAVRRTDLLGTVTVSSTDPGKQGTTVGAGVITLDQPLSQGSKIAGTVKSARLDENGAPIEPQKPVAGALVVVDEVLPNRPPGFIRPGELVATTSLEGSFALFTRPGVQGIGREVLAMHPRFPFQTARVAFQLNAQNTAVARVGLLFEEGSGNLGPVRGTAPPVLHISHFPALPSVGQGDNDIVELILSAFDDFEVTAPTLEVTRAELPNGEVREGSAAQALFQIVSQTELQASTSRKIKSIKIRGSVKAKVNLKAIVFDDGGLEAALDYTVNFGFSASIDPTDLNDRLGPYVSLVWPPPFAQNIPSLSPILVRFAEPIHARWLEPENWQQWFTLDSSHTLRFIEATPDRREVLVFYSGNPDGDVSFSVHSPLTDQNGNAFDQFPSEDGTNALSSRFSQAGQVEAELEGSGAGGGIVVEGRYAYAAERGTSDGRMVLYDLEKPGEPEAVDNRVLPGRPTTMTLIPSYTLPKYSVDDLGIATTDGCEEPASYVAVFMGAANEIKQLLLMPANGDLHSANPPSVTATLNINQDAASQVIKSKWDPPFLGYLDLGDNFTSMTLLNLPAFHLGASLRDTAPEKLRLLPHPGDPGNDENGDGDYCDPLDRAPLPFLDPLHPFGFSFSFSPEDPAERIEDFDFDSGLGLAAVVTTFRNGGDARIRVVLAATDPDPLDDAIVTFGSGVRPKRIFIMPAVRLDSTNGPILRDIAIVSIGPSGTATDGSLAIIDVTDPSAPQLLNQILVPPGEGMPGTINRRPDGLLALATTRSILLLDPSKLALTGAPSRHPAFESRVDLPAGGVRDFVADPSGINAIFGGASRRLVQTAPGIQVVTFDEEPFKPETLVGRPETEVRSRLSRARAVPVVEMAKLDANNDIIPDLAPQRHHYVLIDAPGGHLQDGTELPLVVAAINETGQLYDRRAKEVVPAIIGDEAVHKALLLKQLIRVVQVLNDALATTAQNAARRLTLVELAQSAFESEELRKVLPDFKYFAKLATSWPLPFKARRLSDDPSSSLYNRYLAGPFLVLPNSPEEDIVDRLLEQAEQRVLDRRYLRASPRLWVGFPSDFKDHPVLGQFASQFRLNPHLTLEGFDVPAAGALADQLVQSILGSSEILGPVLLAVFSQFTPVAADYKPTLLPGANLLRQVAYKDRPLIFVPGFAGSRLNQANGEVWPGLFSGSKTNLSITPAGQPVNPTSPPDALRYAIEVAGFGIGEIYGGLIRHLTNSQGYVEYDYFNPALPDDRFRSYQEQRRRLNGAPNLGQDPRPDLFVFAYDWRLDNARSARLLEEYIKIAKYYHPDADGVDLIAHSNGNLVARKFMLDNPGVVRRYLTAGAPWLGAAKPLLGLLTGDAEDLALNFIIPIGELETASQFMPGFHQLLSSKGTFDLGFRPVVEVGFDVNRDGTNYQSYTYPQYANALATNLFRQTHAAAGFTGAVSPVRANHENFHEPDAGLRIGNASQDPPDVEVHQLVSVQSSPRTLAGARFVGRLHRNPTNVENVTLDLPSLQVTDSEEGTDVALSVGEADGSLGITTNQFRFRGDIELIRSLGDGTVPILSLGRGYRSDRSGRGFDMTPPNSKLYSVTSTNAAQDEHFGHNPVLNNPILRDWVDRILMARRLDRLQVSIAAPVKVAEGSGFTASISRSAIRDANGNVTTLIDFGDGGHAARVTGFGAPAIVNYRYRQNGVYTISVGATTTKPLSGFDSRQIEVTNVAPRVDIEGGDVTVAINETRIFVARVTDPGVEDSHTFSWKVDGDILAGQHAFAAAVNFFSVGQHTVTVTATDSDGGVGTKTINVTVEPGRLPQPPAPFAGNSFTAPAKGGLVFESQPEVQIRITGIAPGPSDTKGVKVRERTDPIFLEKSADFPPISQLFNVVAFELRRVLAAAVDVFVQRTAKETVMVNLLRRADAEGNATTETIVEFKALGGPLEVELLYVQGGTPFQLTTWITNATPNARSSIKFDWVSLDATLETGSDTIPINYEALGLAAADRQPPAVAALFNPATGNVTLVARDNFTTPQKLQMFLVQDSSGDGRLEDEVFYELVTNVLVRARMPSRKFAIVARDEAGNVSNLEGFTIFQTSDYTLANAPYCDDLQSIRGAVQSAIQAGLNAAAVNDLFLLRRSDLWIFEQGSGACLWKENSCVECNGNFVPKISDNDYELFLPVHLARNFLAANDTDRLEFMGSGPHEPSTRRGDWYFKPPTGLDSGGAPTTDPAAIQTWQYELPAGFTTPLGETLLLLPKRDFTNDLSDGFPFPLTPAEIISRTLTQVITNDASVFALLKQTTFFPARREHFMYGVLDLELPPEDGPDPIGDGGCGRQMLLLKWVLEGEFADLSSELGVNQGLPSLDLIHRNLSSAGVPLAEGLEWGLFQEFAALDGGVAVDLNATYGPSESPQQLVSAAGNDVQKARQKKLKKMGKSAIRAALARLAGTAETSQALFSVNRQTYASRGLRSFEDYILNVITNNPEMASDVFGDFARNRPPEEGPDLFDFLKAKKADDQHFFNEILRDPQGYRRFILGGLDFLRTKVQQPAKPAYDNYLEALSSNGGVSEFALRRNNLLAVMNGRPPERKGLKDLYPEDDPVIHQLAVQLANYGSQNRTDTRARIERVDPAPAPAPAAFGDGPVAAPPDLDDETEEILLGDLLSLLAEGEGDDTAEVTVDLPPERNATLDLIAELGDEEDPQPSIDDSIHVERSRLPIDPNPLLPERIPYVRVKVVVENAETILQFRVVDQDEAPFPEPVTIELIGVGGQTPTLQTTRLNLSRLPGAFAGIEDFIVQGRAGSEFDFMPLTTTLTPLFRDGRRTPDLGEVNLLNAIREAFPFPNGELPNGAGTDNADNYIHVMSLFLRPIWQEIAALPDLNAFRAITNQINAVFATEADACEAINKLLSMGHMFGSRVYFNPGRQKLGPREKEGFEGLIFLNTALQQPGNIQIHPANPSASPLGIVMVEFIHEMDIRAVRIMRDGRVRQAQTTIVPFTVGPHQEHQLLDRLARSENSVLRTALNAYPGPTQEADQEPECPP